MIFNIEKEVIHDIFNRYIDSYVDAEDLADIVDRLCEVDLPNTQLMGRIVHQLKKNFDILEPIEIINWFQNDARFVFEANNIPIHVDQLYDEDDDIDFETQVEEKSKKLKDKGWEVYHTNSDFNYYEVICFKPEIRTEVNAMFNLLFAMTNQNVFDIYKL